MDSVTKEIKGDRTMAKQLVITRQVKMRKMRNKTSIPQTYYNHLGNPIKIPPGERRDVSYVEETRKYIEVDD